MRKLLWVNLFYIAALTVMLTTTAATAFANSAVEIRLALDQGHFNQAAKMGQSLATAEGLALAAEAIAAPVLLGDSENQKDRAKEALTLAKAAVALDPNSQEARLQVALALGFVTRASNPITVWRKGLAGELSDAIARHQDLAPNDARGHALLGAWHYGIVRKAGKKRALKWYEATFADGNIAYNKALELAPDDIIIKANYALSLVETDYQRHQTRANKMLKDAVNTPPKTAIENAVQNRMLSILNNWTDERFVVNASGDWLDGK